MIRSRTEYRDWRTHAGLATLLVLAAAPGDAQQTRDSLNTGWPRGAVCYEVFVRSFYDSDGDGIGDLSGLVEKLDYVQGLGARCIWLMPVAASPSYHGYDVTDYYRVDPDYGTNADFKRLIAEAHQRGIRVLVDLVLNHLSSEHQWFQDALHRPTSPYRDWFRWSPEHPGVLNPWGGDNWHRSPVRDEYYYGFFWHGMPDLNYETAAVREEAKRIATFWLDEMGVDGFRLDAIKFLVEDGSRIQHAPGTHAFLREFAAHVRRVKPDAFTIGEVWDPTDSLLAYSPDQLDAYFAFEVSDSIVSAVRSGAARGLLAPVLRLQDALPPERWAPFLRNHDQTRTLTALGGDMRRARLAATLLLTLPGLPFLYYGEEIGMTGDKPDPRLRTPMHWSLDPHAGFTTGTPWAALQPDSFTANVAVQDGDPESLLELYRRLIHLRSAHPALGSGRLVPLEASHNAVVAYVRREGNRTVLVVANLGDAVLADVALTSPEGMLPEGRYALTNLLGGPADATLTVGADGRITDRLPVEPLPALMGHVFDISISSPPHE